MTKPYRLFSLIPAALMASSLMISCSKSDSNPVTPTPPPTTPTTKVCPPGYEGADCNIETRNRYIGTYVASDTCPTATPPSVNYSTTISLVPGDVT